MFLLLLIIFFALIFYCDSYFLNYWKRLGIKQCESSFFLGSIKELVLGRQCMALFFKKIYDSTKDVKFFGIYFTYRPALIINDPQLIKNVLIKDYNTFHDRGMNVDPDNDPLTTNLFFLEGMQHKILRAKLTPIFSTRNMKEMFPTLMKTTDHLLSHLEEKIEKQENLFDMQNLIACWATDFIGSIFFGLDIDSINNPDNEFRVKGKKFFSNDLKQNFRLMSAFLFGKAGSFLKIKVVESDIEEFFISIIEETIDYREKHGIERKDFLQLMIKLKNNETDGCKLTLQEVYAQAFLFFMAGFETTSMLTSYFLYEMAENPLIQKKLQDEIDENGLNSIDESDISYEKLNGMEYLHCCIKETLRKYPPVPFLNRITMQDYLIPDSEITIEKGTIIFIPVYGIHHDPNIYPNPAEFLPERFIESTATKRDGVTYLPFGEGPKQCLGMKLGYVMAKLIITAILSKFNITSDNTEYSELEFEPRSLVLCPKKNIHLRVSKRL